MSVEEWIDRANALERTVATLVREHELTLPVIEAARVVAVAPTIVALDDLRTALSRLDGAVR